MLHLTKLCCTSHIYAAPHIATLHPTKLRCTPQIYPTPCELSWTLLSYAVHHWASQYPTELLNNLWAALHPTELRCTPLSYSAQTLRNLKMNVYLWKYPDLRCLINYAILCTLWATLHFVSYTTPSELRCTLLSYAVPHWALLYPTELPNNLWAALHPTELRCTPLSYGAQTLRNEMNDNLMRQYPWSQVLDKL